MGRHCGFMMTKLLHFERRRLNKVLLYKLNQRRKEKMFKTQTKREKLKNFIEFRSIRISNGKYRFPAHKLFDENIHFSALFLRFVSSIGSIAQRFFSET